MIDQFLCVKSKTAVHIPEESPGASGHHQETLCHVGADGKYSLYVVEPVAPIEPVVDHEEKVVLWGMESEPGSSLYLNIYIYNT